jgi:hypothetical protein
MPQPSSARYSPTPPWRRLLIAALASTVGMAASPAAQATDTLNLPGNWSAGLFAGEALNDNLVDVLPKAIQGDLDFEPARLAGVVIRRGIEPPAFFAEWGARNDILVSTSLELTLVKSRGLTHNTELALDWRPSVTPWRWGPVSFEFAWGFGVSQSFGQPWSDYTDPDKPEGYRTLFHMTPEIALHHADLPNWSLAMRIHHRSGIYGLAGPRKVGSNHLALVLMHGF